jgi:hypothetical protein
MKYFITIVMWIALAGTAMAVPPGPPTDGDSGVDVTTSADSVSASNSDSVASSSSDSVSGASAGASSGANGTLNSSTEYTSKTTAWALDVPSATAAPSVALECIEHTRGWSLGPVFGMSGRTRYNIDCVAFSRCITKVETYGKLGERQLALAELATCSLPALEE